MTNLSHALGRIQPSATMAMSGRVAELKAQGVDVIGLSAGEPDFDTPDFVKEAAIKAIRDGETKYTAVDGTAALKEAVAAKFLRDNDLTYAPSQITVNSGGKHTLFNALVATLDAGDEVIIPAPYWVSYPDIVSFAGGTPVVVAASAGQNYKITPEQLEAAITPKTKWLILNSPSNPSGAAYSGEELKALGEVIVRHEHVMVMTDDMYEHIWYADFPFTTIAQVCPELYDRILTVNGCSKAYAMTGWRIGYAGGPEWLIAAMRKLQSQSTSKSLRPQQWRRLTARRISSSNAIPPSKNAAIWWCRCSMTRRGLIARCPVPDGAFYVYPDASALMGKVTPKGKAIETDQDLIGYFLDEAKVAAVHGGAFGLSPAFRVSYATSEEILREACTRIQQACVALS